MVARPTPKAPAAGAPRSRRPQGLRIELSEPDAIKMALKTKGYSLTTVAAELHVTRPAVSLVILGYRRSERILAHLAAILDVPVDMIRPRKPVTVVSIARTATPVNVRVSTSSRHGGSMSGRRCNAA